MCLYEFIRSIVLGSEPDSKDEFEVLDQIHGEMHRPW